MRNARLGSQNIEREAERLKTLLNLGLDIFSDDLGGVNFTTTTTGSWVDSGLSIAVTPTRSVHALCLLRGILYHSAAPANVQGRIVYDSTNISVSVWQELTQAVNKWWSVNLWGVVDLTAGTAYTIKFQLYNSTAGTLTLVGSALYTQLAVALAHKAVLA